MIVTGIPILSRDLGERSLGRENDGYVKSGPVHIPEEGEDGDLGPSEVGTVV